ncbi:2-methylcitrate dehydratase [Bordetella genomosp. 8]|uniref:2-methylcitrate dehydratase n=1 Tax=Bordetella genomosp. 8 TaxID=1416806 RepID=A0A1W6YGP5_9BORD|nr:MmgE/PrpD family protein [Bordetella genomosp. 8]ARP80189.1 2-methylcitrate dehydratase [Bordetella genomosp. 8]
MSKESRNPEVSISQRLARGILAAEPQKTAGAREVGRRMLLDIVGICIAARDQNYVEAAMAAIDGDGPCTVLGHGRRMGAEGAAFVNGIAAHGEDFDDTFEGGPVHAGVVIVPALLAAAERHGLSGQDFLRGLAVGSELMCRLCAVAPTKVHKAGFHPTAVFGVMGAVAGIGAALRLTERQLVDAFGIAGSMASGIIEYLSDGSWTKRMHPGWAAQSGYRAVRLALEGFKGPRTVFEGTHGLFHGFANTLDGDFDAMMADFGQKWIWETIAFKPYACGTMCHPYIDCAREFGKLGIDPASIVSIECEAAEGVLHRLWEPLDQKRSPPNGYAAKFSVPYAIAVAIVRGDAGLREYDDVIVKDAAILGVASKVSYVVDPQNPYPRQFTGHVRVKLDDGKVHEFRQGYFKGGAEHPLSDEDLTRKFQANCAYGGLGEAEARALLAHIDGAFERPTVDFAQARR